MLGNYLARLAFSSRVERTAAPSCKMIIPMPSPLHDFLPQFPWQSDRDFCLPSHGHNGQLVHRACIGVYRPIATASCCRSWFMSHCLLAHGSGRTIPIVWIHPSLIYPFFSLVAPPFSPRRRDRYRSSKSPRELVPRAWPGDSSSSSRAFLSALPRRRGGAIVAAVVSLVAWCLS